MLKKWSLIVFGFFIIASLLFIPDVHAQRQHDSAEEVENGMLSDTSEEEAVSFSIELDADPANGGMVAGSGSYEKGTEITVTANAKDGYEFVHWVEAVITSEIGDNSQELFTETEIIVNNLPKYTFIVAENRNLIAIYDKDSYHTSIAEKVIATDVTAQNDNDIDTYLSIRTSVAGMPENKDDIEALIKNTADSLHLIENVESAYLTDLSIISHATAQNVSNINSLSKHYEKVEAYYVSIDYEFKEETHYYQNGNYYKLYILGYLSGQWKIVESSILTSKFINDYKMDLEVDKEPNVMESQQVFLLQQQANPPTNIRVLRRQLNRIDVVDFYEYQKGVLPKEWYASWGSSTMDSLYAGALAVKMYAWDRTLNPMAHNYDICDSTHSQVYKPEDRDSYWWTFTDKAVEDMRGIGMFKNDGSVFSSEYTSGVAIVDTSVLIIRENPGTDSMEVGRLYLNDKVNTLSNAMIYRNNYHWYQIRRKGATQALGWVAAEFLVLNSPARQNMVTFKDRLSTWGTRHWAYHGKDYRWILKHFYDYTPRTNSQAIQFIEYEDVDPPSSLTFTNLTPSTVNADSAPYDAFLTATGTNFNNVNRITLTWTGASGGGGPSHWDRGSSRWNEAVNILSDTEMTLEPRVVGSTATWSGTDEWTVTLRDTTGATASRTFTVNFNTTESYTLSVDSTNPSSGVTITSSTGHGGTTPYCPWPDLSAGTFVSLTAPEYVGSGDSRKSFSSWSGDVSSSNRTINFTMDGNKTVTANYVDDHDPDCSVNTPDRPSGPTSGEPGVNYTYSTGGSSCAAGHSVEYRFSWRKVGESWTFTSWSSSDSTTLNFSEAGTYEIDAQARCAHDNSVTSAYSDVLTVEIEADPDCSVNTPDRPSGPTSGEPGVNYTYSTGGSSCAAGHSVEYRFSWRKVGESWTSTSWSSSASTTLNFSEEGTYEIDAQARCAHDNSVTSTYSDVLTVEIEDDPDCSVNTPDRPLGPTTGKVGELMEFEAGGSSCSAGHSVEYRFGWGDGTNTSWSLSNIRNNSWSREGTYRVRAQARCLTNPSVVSDISEPITVVITKDAIEPVEKVDLSASPTGWQYAEEEVTFTANVTEGNQNAEFAFYFKLPGGNWILARSYAQDASWKLNTPYVGELEIGVIARAVGSEEPLEALDIIDYDITALE